MKRFILLSITAVTVAAAGVVRADDRWDLGNGDCSTDDTSSIVCNQLIHGQPQEHDVQATSPARDVDWMVVETKARHSYEVRVFSASTTLGTSATFPSSASLLLNRVNAAGTVLTTSFGPDGTLNYSDTAGWITTRWMGGATNQRDFIRVEGRNYSNPDANNRYVIELLDTTYFIPRFNNAGSQITVLLIQNTTAAAVTGSIYFYSQAGTLLHTEPLNVAVHGLQIVATASIGALAGLSGSATISHTGGYGALAGKAVALEPSTGFSFDTVAMPLPR